MHNLEKIKVDIAKAVNKKIKKELVKGSDFVYPPDAKMGDLSLPCFQLAKQLKKSPMEIAQSLKDELIALGSKHPIGCLEPMNKSITNTGPYLNFVLDQANLANQIIDKIKKEENKYGTSKIGKNKKLMVEFAHPNTHKAFHIGHLRTLITGESIARILNSLGYKIVRANYQGDVGPHVAKCIWGVKKLEAEYIKINKAKVTIDEKVKFLGKAYVLGSKNYEESEAAKKEITELNKAIYEEDKDVKEIYKNTRNWSLDYFEKIYKLLGTKFDRLYFESEVFTSGKEIVLKNLKKNVFKKSDGAIIFEGEKEGLHDRVFINSQGFPTYEAKELGLAKLQTKEYKPDAIIHVVANEQAEYFKVLFCALAKIDPKTKEIQKHLSYAMVDLKNGKMSSRRGNVVLGEWLLSEVREKIVKIIKQNKELKNIDEIATKVSLAAVKYFILKNNTNKKILFDINESVSLSGSSGPYLQYSYTRIQSILRKEKGERKKEIDFENLKEVKEHELIIQLAKYPEVVLKAGTTYDPSEIAKYLFELCKLFNDYYHAVPILKTEDNVRDARLALISAVGQVIQNGLGLLGVETVEKM